MVEQFYLCVSNKFTDVKQKNQKKAIYVYVNVSIYIYIYIHTHTHIYIFISSFISDVVIFKRFAKC